MRNHARLTQGSATQDARKFLVASEEFPNPQPHLNRVNAGVWCGKTCVRDVHIPQFETHIVLCAEDVHAERCLIHKIDRICSRWDVMRSEQGSAGEFQVRRNSAVALEVPLQSERIEAHSEGGIGRLKR